MPFKLRLEACSGVGAVMMRQERLSVVVQRWGLVGVSLQELPLGEGLAFDLFPPTVLGLLLVAYGCCSQFGSVLLGGRLHVGEGPDKSSLNTTTWDS